MMRYLELYSKKIMPRLQAIDIALKSCEENFSDQQLIELLDISHDELSKIISTLELKEITAENFMSIMLLGSSEICRLYQRELERNSPLVYTPDDISYIYNLDTRTVEDAFERISATKVSSYMLINIFADIDVK